MIRTLSASHTQTHTGIRRLDVRRDLRPIADLIAEAFASELDAKGRSSLQELRTLARLGPLLYLLVPANGELGGFFRGFVWEDKGHIVGNITLQQADVSRRVWIISNVSVSRTHRGQGIARQLMMAAGERVAKLGGSWTVLQVRSDNDVARSLYEHLGYSSLFREIRLRCYPEAFADPLPLPSDAELRPLAALPLQALQILCRQSIPEAARWWQPRSSVRFQQPHDTGFMLKLKSSLGWQHRRRWGLYRGDRLDGVLEVRVAPAATHHIDLLLHPDLRPAWTRPILAYGLRQLHPYGPQATTAVLYDYQPQAITTLQEFGFRVTLELSTMRKAIT